MITVNGIVISSREANENDRYVDIITDELGVISFAAKGARKNTSRGNASTQLFAYSSFSLNESKGRYYLDSAKPISIFYGIRKDLKKVALASYFAELTKYAVMALQPAGEIMRLLLNSLHFLSEGTFCCAQLKSVFELRFACCTGFTPLLLGCKECHMFTSDYMYFIYEDGSLMCRGHYNIFYSISGEEFYPVTSKISATVLHVMRLICLTEMEKIFSFRLKGESLEKLSEVTQCYLLRRLDHNFKTLEYYNELKDL